MDFHKTQENGDATSNYDITTSANTVREFVYEVIEYMQKHDEWGSIYVFVSKNSGYITLVDYSRFKVDFSNSYGSYCNKLIKRIWANGGWGAMSYYITCKEEE
jgi:hypothetical protein